MPHPALSPTLAVFVLASLVLAVTPGPGVIYLVTRTLAGGRRAGLASVGGVALGNLGNAALASVGLAAVLAVSARAFTAVKLAGAAYLLYLGIRELRRARHSRHAPRGERRPPVTRTRVFRDGFLVALLNPKTALFFGAFLPQFVDPARPPLAQSLALGAAFVAIAVCTDTLYVLAAARLGPRIAHLGMRPALTRLAGFSFIALGLVVACSESRSTR
jgi:threonine/homoserine/homoserine lactone efflux protein